MEKKDKGGRKRLRPGPGDWILLLLALCVAGLGVLYFRGREGESEREVTVRYVIRVPALEAGTLPATEEWRLAVNGEAKDGTGKRDLGTVEAIGLRPHWAYGVRDGNVVLVELPGMVIPEITVRSSARLVGERELRIGELRLAAGMRGDFIVGGFLLKNAEILWVEVTE